MASHQDSFRSNGEQASSSIKESYDTSKRRLSSNTPKSPVSRKAASSCPFTPTARATSVCRRELGTTSGSNSTSASRLKRSSGATSKTKTVEGFSFSSGTSLTLIRLFRSLRRAHRTAICLKRCRIMKYHKKSQITLCAQSFFAGPHSEKHFSSILISRFFFVSCFTRSISSNKAAVSDLATSTFNRSFS